MSRHTAEPTNGNAICRHCGLPVVGYWSRKAIGANPMRYRHARHRRERAMSDERPLTWDADLTPHELVRLADAIRKADHRNWSAAELADRIAGTVRAIAAARADPVASEGLQEALLRIYDLSMTSHIGARLDIREVARAALEGAKG